MTKFVINDPRTSALVATVTKSQFGPHTSIGVERDGEVIGGVVLDNYNVRSICIHVAGQCGKSWLTRKFIAFVFGYVYDGLKCEKLIGIVPEGNVTARKFDESLGFTLETRITEAHPQGDLLIYSMLREQCKWLKGAK